MGFRQKGAAVCAWEWQREYVCVSLLCFVERGIKIVRCESG